jgi:RHS repeat-associated protein
MDIDAIHVLDSSPSPTPLPQGWHASSYTYSTDIPHAVAAVDRGSFTDSYSYDVNGNMTCRVEKGMTYIQTYNAENRIASITRLAGGSCAAPGSSAATWDFTYDGDGVRTGQSYTAYTDGEPATPVITRYYFGGALEVTNGAVRKYYSLAGQTVAMRDQQAGLQYLLTDQLGSVVAVVASDGTLTSQHRYLPFGEPRADVSSPHSSPTDFGYTGQRALDEGMGGIMDYKARFYSPYINRFLSADTIVPGLHNPQSLNRYSYVGNSPINYVDPSGHMRLREGPQQDRFSQSLAYAYRPQPSRSGYSGNNNNNVVSEDIPVIISAPSAPDILSTLSATPAPTMMSLPTTLHSTPDPFVSPLPVIPTQTPTPFPQSYSYPVGSWLDYLDQADLILDGGGLIVDCVTVGSGGRYVNAIEIVGKGLDQADLIFGAISISNDIVDNETDWYSYTSFATDLVGIVVPIAADATGLVLNAVHANQLYIASLER